MTLKRIFVFGIAVLLVIAIVAFVVIYRKGYTTTRAQVAAPIPTSTPMRTPTGAPILTAPALSPSPTLLPMPSPAPTVAFGQTVQLAWFYRSPLADDLPNLARNFGVFILTRLDEPARDSLRALGVKKPFLQYYRFDAIHDPGACNKKPFHNQVAMEAGDYCLLAREHPDWFLRDVSGNLIVEKHDGARYVMMNPGNPGWRAYWVERARQYQQQFGWEGFFLDNVEASLAKLKRNGFTPAGYADDAAYQNAVEAFLAYVATNFASSGKPIWGNIIAVQDSSIWFRYLKYLDGVMEESFAVDFSDYQSADEWERQMTRIEQAQALGKQVILVAQGTRDDIAREQFTFASYLLVNAGRASFRYTDSRSYDTLWLYANYNFDLGVPLAPRFRDGNVWRREFERGSARVDPVAHTGTITTR